MSDPVHVEDVRVTPPAASWAGLLRRPTLDSRSSRFREQLSLPTDRPIIMTGHQCAWWHPGILAKYFACAAAASALDAHPAWVWVDQDDNEADVVPYPAVGENDNVVAGRWVLNARGPKPAAHAAAGAPALSSIATAPTDIHPRTRADWPQFVTRHMTAHADAASLARQVAGALADALATLDVRGHAVFATTLCQTDLGAQLLEHMKADPRSCVSAYNHAAQRHPGAGIRPLALAARIELPLWRLQPGAPRRTVFADELNAIPLAELAPKALLMTAMLRLAACDLFIHGTGGGVYDAITDEWMRAWRLETLAPSAVVTATLRLPLLSRPAPPEADVAQAAARAHRARHDPTLLGDDGAARAKRASLQEIRTLPRGSHARRAAFASMHRTLDTYRAAHQADIEALFEQAATQRRDRTQAAVALSRTWPFIQHSPIALEELRSEVSKGIPQR